MTYKEEGFCQECEDGPFEELQECTHCDKLLCQKCLECSELVEHEQEWEGV